MGNMGIPEPRNMVPGIPGTVENGSGISRYHFLRSRESHFPQNMGRDQGIPFPGFHMASFTHGWKISHGAEEERRDPEG